MRELTDEERTTQARRREGFVRFVEESLPLLADFLERLELPDPYSVAENAEKFLEPIDRWMRNQSIDAEDRTWIMSRIAAFIGELLSQKYGGRWYLEENSDSPYFNQYVVGQFNKLQNPNVEISPFAIANNFVDEPLGRSLVATLSRIEEGLMKLQ